LCSYFAAKRVSAKRVKKWFSDKLYLLSLLDATQAKVELINSAASLSFGASIAACADYSQLGARPRTKLSS